MIRDIDKYVNILLESRVGVSSLEDALKTVQSSQELSETLDNPNVTPNEKQQVVNDIFAPSVRSFIGKLSAECKVAELDGIISAYIEAIDKEKNIAHATVYCLTPPNDEQLDGIKSFVCKEEKASDAVIEIVNDEKLIGGFIIRVSGKEFDFSIKGKMESIKNSLWNPHAIKMLTKIM